MAEVAPRTEPGLGPYRGPVVVLALIAVIVVGGLLIAVVGAVRSPDDVSNSATVLGTFPIDPDAPGIPAGPADPEANPDAGTVPGGATTVPGSTLPGTSGPDGPTTVPGPATSGPDGSTTVPAGAADAFDGALVDWEPVVGEWATEDGELVGPEGTDAAPAFLLRSGSATGIGAEVGAPARAAGLVVGYADAGTYVAALAVPALGGWRLEVRVDGEEVASASVPAPTGAGTGVALVLAEGRAALLVDGAQAGSVEAAGPLGDRVGFVARGPAGARWASAVEGP